MTLQSQPSTNSPFDPSAILPSSHPEENAYTFTTEEVARLRCALAKDTGSSGTWSDDEIRAMARSTLDLMRTLLAVTEAQRRRGLE